jgi:MoxR-like ATPase
METTNHTTKENVMPSVNHVAINFDTMSKSEISESIAQIIEQIKTTVNSNVLQKQELEKLVLSFGVTQKDFWKHFIPSSARVKRGHYDLDLIANPSPVKSENMTMKMQESQSDENANTQMKLITQDTSDDVTYIPEKSEVYVPWGNFANVRKVLESKMFFPLYISGPSGNGKTFMVEQAASKAGVKFIRVQLTPETDEDDLIGGFRLIDGNTVFCKGPVIRAMEEGAVLLLDEIDRATNKIMCLQSVLEGKSVLIKKTGETVSPALGFNIVATANTLGRGSDDGRYTAASIIDDAFLERFPITVNQTWATPSVERKILDRHMNQFDCDDSDFVEKLVTWAGIIRKTFEDGGIDDEVSTRRLCHIVQTYSIFNDRKTAIELSTNRFDAETREAILDLYDKLEEDPSSFTNDDENKDEDFSDPLHL